MQRIARRLDRHIGKLKPLGQHAVQDKASQAVDHKGADIGEQVHLWSLHLLRRVYHARAARQRH